MDADRPTTIEELFRMKADERKVWAQAPFEEKLQELLRLQRINYAMKRAAGGRPIRPWSMSESQYRRETGLDDFGD
jgi:hypothetical protein